MKDKKIEIDFACPKQWSSMQKVDDTHRHCSECDKLVTDFTQSTENAKSGECGHFTLDQLARIKNTVTLPRMGLYSLSLLTILGVSAVYSDSAAQNAAPVVRTQKAPAAQFKIRGTVYDRKTKEPLPLVNIVVLKKGVKIHGTQTDFDGLFNLEIDTVENDLQEIQIAFNVIGYQADTLSYTEDDIILKKERILVELESVIFDPDSVTIIHVVNGGLNIPKDTLQIPNIHDIQVPKSENE